MPQKSYTKTPPEELIKITIPAKFKGKDRESAEAAVLVYLEGMELERRALSSTGVDWSRQLTKYWVGVAHTELLEAVEYWHSRKIEIVGEIRGDLKVSEVKGLNVTISGCMDNSNVDLLKDGKSVRAPDEKGTYLQYVYTAYLEYYKVVKGWRVSEVVYDHSQRCLS